MYSCDEEYINSLPIDDVKQLKDFNGYDNYDYYGGIDTYFF